MKRGCVRARVCDRAGTARECAWRYGTTARWPGDVVVCVRAEVGEWHDDGDQSFGYVARKKGKRLYYIKLCVYDKALRVRLKLHTLFRGRRRALTG